MCGRVSRCTDLWRGPRWRVPARRGAGGLSGGATGEQIPVASAPSVAGAGDARAPGLAAQWVAPSCEQSMQAIARGEYVRMKKGDRFHLPSNAPSLPSLPRPLPHKHARDWPDPGLAVGGGAFCVARASLIAPPSSGTGAASRGCVSSAGEGASAPTKTPRAPAHVVLAGAGRPEDVVPVPPPTDEGGAPARKQGKGVRPVSESR